MQQVLAGEVTNIDNLDSSDDNLHAQETPKELGGAFNAKTLGDCKSQCQQFAFLIITNALEKYYFGHSSGLVNNSNNIDMSMEQRLFTIVGDPGAGKS